MRHKLLILGTFASLAATLPLCAAENSGSSVAPPPAALRGKVICRGVQNVPITADAGQVLPMQVVAQFACGEEVAILSDSEGYTVEIRTSDGRSGYIARMYLAEGPSKSSKADRAVEAVVDNGIARWQSGAPGSDQFFNGDSLVESLTANGITVQVSLQDTAWKLRASVAIVNDSEAPVRFNPARFTLNELTPRLRSLAYQNPRELAKAFTHQIYSTNASATAPASATYTKASYKTAAYVPGTPNYFSREGLQDQSPVLQKQTLAPKGKASGVVWFERDKNPLQLNLRIFVEDQIFEFPLSFPPHK